MKKAFTLIELLIVVAIIGILAGVGIPMYNGYIEESKYNSIKKNFNIISENTIKNYFRFIRPKIGKDSIYRLLSPLLNIFFGIPDSKQFKIDIHSKMKDHNFDTLEKIFLKFVNEKRLLIN